MEIWLGEARSKAMNELNRQRRATFSTDSNNTEACIMQRYVRSLLHGYVPLKLLSCESKSRQARCGRSDRISDLRRIQCGLSTPWCGLSTPMYGRLNMTSVESSVALLADDSMVRTYMFESMSNIYECMAAKLFESDSEYDLPRRPARRHADDSMVECDGNTPT